MILILHIAIAVLSVFSAAYAYILPSQLKLKVTYSLVAATLVSGTYLIATMHAPITSTCLTGLGYTALVTTSLIATRHKLARALNK